MRRLCILLQPMTHAPHRSRQSPRRLAYCAVSLAGIALAACSRSQGRVGAGAAAGAGADAALGEPTGGLSIAPAIVKPDFVFTDTYGRPFDFRARTRGRLTLLFFGYTHCPDVCPVQMANVAGALHRVGPVARDVMVVFVTTDSVRDTPTRLRTWLDHFDSSFVGLTGTLERVNAVQRRLPLMSPAVHEPDSTGGYAVGHSALLLAFTPDDSAHFLYPAGVQEDVWAEDLPRLARFGAPAAGP
jgi:protein SCO1